MVLQSELFGVAVASLVPGLVFWGTPTRSERLPVLPLDTSDVYQPTTPHPQNISCCIHPHPKICDLRFGFQCWRFPCSSVGIPYLSSRLRLAITTWALRWEFNPGPVDSPRGSANPPPGCIRLRHENRGLGFRVLVFRVFRV